MIYACAVKVKPAKTRRNVTERDILHLRYMFGIVTLSQQHGSCSASVSQVCSSIYVTFVTLFFKPAISLPEQALALMFSPNVSRVS